jgi:hypothetical protein
MSLMTNQKPTVYSKKLTAQQNAVLVKFENLTGQSPIGLEEFESGEISARELWQQQVAWVEGISADVGTMTFLSDSD